MEKINQIPISPNIKNTDNKENEIDCHLVNGVMSTACFNKDIDEYKFEIEHMAKNYDFEGYQFFNKEKIREEINSKMYLAGLLNSGSYHLNPLKLTVKTSSLRAATGMKGVLSKVIFP